MSADTCDLGRQSLSAVIMFCTRTPLNQQTIGRYTFLLLSDNAVTVTEANYYIKCHSSLPFEMR